MNEFLIMPKKDCTGCNACVNACPVDAILMVPDAEGFWYPQIDPQKCVKCGICEQACPSLNRNMLVQAQQIPAIYAAWTKEESLRISSTSGGVFTELARPVLENGGMVFGARYRDDFSIEHFGVSSLNNLEMLKQSKYAQSDIGIVFREVRRALEEARDVLFCGTPCQSAGLQNYLQGEYERLLICDFVCRGVNSPAVYLNYLRGLAEEYGSEIKTLQFKNKDIGWNQFCTKVVFEDGQVYLKDRSADDFMRGYLFFNLYLRPCCYHCKYKGFPRVSDISLADFWGVGASRPHLDQNKGTSMVLVNTEKGRRAFKQISDRIQHEECSLEEAMRGNRCIKDSVEKTEGRAAFFEQLSTVGSFRQVMQQYPVGVPKRSPVARFFRAFRRHVFPCSEPDSK